MREIGGYIELDKYNLPMLHEGAITLNCGRNCLAYLIEAKKIRKLVLPYFLCDSVKNLCEKYDVSTRYYHINEEFIPQDINLESDEWLYLVNFYGQLSQEVIKEFYDKYGKVILDNAQAYFQMPVDGVDTLYTCRKFFGVADGGILYTQAKMENELPIDESFERMHFLMGRYERTASEFYSEYAQNNRLFGDEPIKKMSKLTKNLLHGIDYEQIKEIRTRNFQYLNTKLGELNGLNLKNVEGAFAYPLLIENGGEVKKRLAKLQIYIPTLWPNVLQEVKEDTLEFKLAMNILPIPVDQRYGKEDMDCVIQEIKKILAE